MSVKILGNENFEAETKSSSKAVIDFSAEWCGPCKMFSPLFKKTAGEIDGVDFFEVDVDKSPDVAQKLMVMSMPTTLFMANGEERHRQVGAVGEDELKKLINEKLG